MFLILTASPRGPQGEFDPRPCQPSGVLSPFPRWGVPPPPCPHKDYPCESLSPQGKLPSLLGGKQQLVARDVFGVVPQGVCLIGACGLQVGLVSCFGAPSSVLCLLSWGSMLVCFLRFRVGLFSFLLLMEWQSSCGFKKRIGVLCQLSTPSIFTYDSLA